MEPKYKFESMGVSVTVWENTRDDKTWLTTKVEKSYKDKEGVWKKTNSFNVNELATVIVLMKEAQRAILLVNKPKD